MSDFFETLELSSVFYEGTWYSPEYLKEQVLLFEKYLNEKIGQNSPFVYLYAPTHLKTIISYIGIVRSGKVAVLLDPGIRALEIEDYSLDTPPGALINIDTSTIDFDYASEIKITNNILSESLKNELENVCTLVYTAAEDGFAKGAMLSKKNLLVNAQDFVSTNSMSSSTVICSLLPLHHLFGVQASLLAPMTNKNPTVLIEIADLRRVKKYLEMIVDTQATHLYSVPVLYYLFSALPRIPDYLKNLTLCASGGSKLTKVIYDTFLKKSGMHIHEGYGLTEASPVCTFIRKDDPVDIESVGRPFPNCQIAIFDENDNMLPTGTVGEVCVRGESVMKGYFNKTSQNAVTLRNNWLHTGDMGILNEQGFLKLTGLKKRMLDVGGKNVYPAEVERYLKKCPLVKDATVTGGTSRTMGHTVTASIKLNAQVENAEEKIRHWCLEHFAAFKIPKDIIFE